MTTALRIPRELLPTDGRFGSGPSLVPPEHVASLNARSWLGTSHRQAPVKNVVGEIRELLAELYQLPEGYEVLLGNGGASLIWDAIPFCLVEDQAQAAVMGEFSSKAARAIERSPFVASPIIRSTDVGRGIECEPRPGVDTYIYAHNETSTGAMVPVRRILSDGADGSAPPLTVVDGTSAAGGVLIDATSADFYYFSPQKCFAADGGLWLALASPDAIERIERLCRERWVPDILSLGLALDNSRKNQTLNTPSLANLHLIAEQLRWMTDRGGLAAMDERTRASSSAIYEWTDAREWTRPFVEPQYRSQVVVTIDIDPPADQICRVLAENGIVDVAAYRSLGRNQLRIATFPAVEPDDVRQLLACVDWVAERV